MGYWNYRVIKHEKEGQTWLSIHEVYYGDDGKLTGFTVRATEVLADDEVGVKEQLERMMEAMTKPVLTPEDFSPAINPDAPTNGGGQ